MVTVTEDIRYIGVNDRDLDLFEGQYIIPNGIAYNSYVIMDEKIAVMDTVDKRKTAEFLENLERELGDRTPDYLVVSHVEPDHASSVKALTERYPEMKLVGNTKTFQMLSLYFDLDLSGAVTVKDGDTLKLGRHELTFVTAPMVHWPEVMVSYDSCDKVLFSADGFGKFGALDADEDWDCEARRYYFNIVGKYGPQVQALMKKAAGLDIQVICPLHGPILKESIAHVVEKYQIWSSYVLPRQYRGRGEEDGRDSGEKGLPEGGDLGSGKGRHGRGAGGCVPLWKNRSRSPVLQCVGDAVYGGFPASFTGKELSEAHSCAGGKRILGAVRGEVHEGDAGTDEGNYGN